MKTFVIHLERATARRAQVDRLLSEAPYPATVLSAVDGSTLDTLPEREFSAGIAEVIKYGLIADSDFFDWLEDNAALLHARDCGAWY